MANISELELQNLRHLIGGYEITHCKLQDYAEAASDQKVKQFFEKGAQSAMENKGQLMKFLQAVRASRYPGTRSPWKAERKVS